ncbi:protease family s26 mitochondrial inner membrane protease-related protein [Babesia gibsoni]|uniref:Protease family s26 mitochondrial inner membrane protease-related protein n=1 Tax=Babesia gibsoni TaxID=33632 RepID=A0AAD8LGJ4_BABGI|nr:protease family s26 mitochondrial inner membrane protease-related protein [Babesia gibsoni]
MGPSGFSRVKLAARSVVYTACAVHLVTNYAVDVTMTKGPSMSPLISERGSLVLYARPPLLRLLRGSSAPLYKDGDVVIGISPTNAKKRICKRICSTENEQRGQNVIPRGYVWIEGDNKSNSLDSRHYGAVSSHLLIGRVFVIVSSARGVEFL